VPAAVGHEGVLVLASLVVVVLAGFLVVANHRLRRSRNRARRLGRRLEAERRQLENIINGTRAGTWAWNVQTGETRFNAHWAAMLGYTLAELEPTSILTWERLTHPEDLAGARAALEDHFAGRSGHYFAEMRMRHREGHWVWIEDRGTVVERSADGLPLWMYGTHLDISERKRLARAHEELLQRIRRLARHVPGVVYQFQQCPDGRARFPFASEGIRDIYGCTPEQAAEDAAVVLATLHPDDLDEVAAGIASSARTLAPWQATYRVVHPAQGLRWVEGSATPEVDAEGCVTWHGYIRDITELHESRERLRLAASVLEVTREGVMVTDARRRIVDVNPAFTQITSYTREEALGQPPSMLASGMHDADFYAAMDRALEQDGFWRGEVWNRRRDGEVYAELLSIAVLRDESGAISHYVGVFTDISSLIAQRSELDRLAHYDALTGIPNRRLMLDRLAQAIAMARRNGEPLAVCVLDLDGFKPVNDRFGHEAGDRLLVEIARRLQDVLRAGETVARLGGDEFVLLLRNPEGPAVFDRVLAAVREPVELREGQARVTASIGVSWLRPGIEDGGQLLREADQALYRAKATGRDRLCEFDG